MLFILLWLIMTGDNGVMKSCTGGTIDHALDKKMEDLFNDLLNGTHSVRNPHNDRSLGEEMDRVLPKLPPEAAGILYWYVPTL